MSGQCSCGVSCWYYVTTSDARCNAQYGSTRFYETFTSVTTPMGYKTCRCGNNRDSCTIECIIPSETFDSGDSYSHWNSQTMLSCQVAGYSSSRLKLGITSYCYISHQPTNQPTISPPPTETPTFAPTLPGLFGKAPEFYTLEVSFV